MQNTKRATLSKTASSKSLKNDFSKNFKEIGDTHSQANNYIISPFQSQQNQNNQFCQKLIDNINQIFQSNQQNLTIKKQRKNRRNPQKHIKSQPQPQPHRKLKAGSRKLAHYNRLITRILNSHINQNQILKYFNTEALKLWNEIKLITSQDMKTSMKFIFKMNQFLLKNEFKNSFHYFIISIEKKRKISQQKVFKLEEYDYVLWHLQQRMKEFEKTGIISEKNYRYRENQRILFKWNSCYFPISQEQIIASSQSNTTLQRSQDTSSMFNVDDFLDLRYRQIFYEQISLTE